MNIARLEAHNFRNLQPLSFTPGPRFTVISGQNGQGKTNLLEAIYVVAALRSFRTTKLADCIAHGQPAAKLAAQVHTGGLDRHYEVTLDEEGRHAKLDGKAARPLSKYFGGFNAVMFAPEDLLLPRASPSDRRDVLNRSVFHATPAYLGVMASYDKTLRSRNAVLRDRARGSTTHEAATRLLEVYDVQLAEFGAQLTQARFDHVRRLAARYPHNFAAIMRIDEASLVTLIDQFGPVADEPLEARRQRLIELLTQRRPQDLVRGTTTAGPHRQDLHFQFGGRDAATTASQGQLRAMALAWKVAELDDLRDRFGAPPVLLLDDVSSELDAARNAYLFEYLDGKVGQCFITTTDAKLIRLQGERYDVSTSHGRFQIYDANT
ncbi:MAG: DNA replication/repair protein RecF [Myxococcales bacterium]|nr:DNA replication/repair protein RecF [Myxococcales bacterium]